jgi:hypothetical protein
MATPEEVMKVCSFMASMYPTFKLTKLTIDAYATMFADTDADMLSSAAIQACKSSEFFPTPARIFQKINAMKSIADPTPDHTQAWDEMVGECRRVGFESWMDTRFTTETIRDVVKTYWRDYCLGDIDGLNTLRAQFRDSYNARIARQELKRDMLPGSNDMIKKLADKLDMGKRLLAGGDNHDSH